MARGRWTGLAVLALCGAGGCGSDLADLLAAAPDPIGALCADDPRYNQPLAGRRLVGEMGHVVFQLVAADPSPVALGLNAWEMQLLDREGFVVHDAAWTVQVADAAGVPSSSVVPQAVARGERVQITPLSFERAGVVQVTPSVRLGNLEDRAVFAYCVPF